MFVAGKALRNTGNEGLVLERQESSNLKILLEFFLCLSKAKAVTMCACFLTHLQNLFGEINKQKKLEYSKVIF